MRAQKYNLNCDRFTTLYYVGCFFSDRYLVPLLERDEFGRCVIFSNAGRFDPYKHTAADMARVHSLVVESLMDDAENQIRGEILKFQINRQVELLT